MKLPHDVSGDELIAALARVGYRAARQVGSHVRLSCELPEPHHVTVPRHDPLKVGMLGAILAEVAVRQGLTRPDLLRRLSL